MYGALRRPRARRPHVWLLALLIATRYAGSDEWHHTCVPGREGTVRDGGIDAVGIVGAWALASRTRLKAMLPRWLAEGW